MKKIISLILLSVIFVTCGDKSDTEPDVLNVNTNSLTFEESAGSQYINITTNTKWTAVSSNAAWLECSPAFGTGNERAQIKVKANETQEPNKGTITIKTPGGLIEVIDVVQASAAPFIVIQPTSVQALSVGEDLNVQVTSNHNWSVQIPTDAQIWVSVKSKTQTVAVLTVKANDTEADRSSSIVFKLDGKDVSTPLALSQKKISSTPTLEVSPTSANAKADGEDVIVNVTSGVLWNVHIPAADTWVTVKDKTNSRVTLNVAENVTGVERSSNVEFRSEDGKTVTPFTISQAKGYTLTSEMTPGAEQAGLLYNALDSYMGKFGFNYSEHPHCTGGYGGHADGVHLAVEKDAYLDKYVFRFDIHIDPVIDGDRCSSGTKDRQRNEMKTATNNSTWAKVQGNWDEWQILEWKFKIPKGYQPTSSFCHIHQLKAQDGPNNGSPVITITPRSDSNGSNRRMQIIHSVDGAKTGKGTIVDKIPLTEFEDEWVQVREEMHYIHEGYYSCKITRIRDGKVLINYVDNNIDMWRSGASFIRSKHGIYRSLAGGDLSKNPVGQSALLKNESVWMCDFKIYEKNSNPNPGQAHD